MKMIFLLKESPLTSCELEYSIQISQPTISYHLKILKAAGIVKINKKGNWKLISLINKPIIKYLFEDDISESYS